MKNIFKLFLIIGGFSVGICTNAQQKIELSNTESKSEVTLETREQAPAAITRNLIQDKKGNIWMATFDGMFKYDGKVFSKVTEKVTSARFFSVLEDRKGNLWFGTIGSGVFKYDGKSFRNFTSKDGLPNNEVGCMYEDKIGNIWFGVNGGVSRYDGKFFRNFLINDDTMQEDMIGTKIPDFSRPPNEVTAILEDKMGNFWFTTRGNTYSYNGQSFSIVNHNGLVFANNRTIIEDRKGMIWLGGPDGLWRKEGDNYVNLSKNFVGHIYEDKKGNIWTSSQFITSQGWSRDWLLTRYNVESFQNAAPSFIEIRSDYDKIKGMIFGILEARDGTIWFGALDGVYRFDGQNIIDAKGRVIKD